MSFDIISIGDCVVDLLIEVPKFPIDKENVILAKSIKIECGGACNFLIMASRLGLKVGAIDKIGNDYYGNFLISELKNEKVDTSFIKVLEGKNSTLVLVIVDSKGNHAFIGFLGASMLLAPNDINPDYIKNARFIYTTGYSMLSQTALNAIVKAIQLAKELSIPIVFDPSPELRSIPKSILKKVISSSRIVLMNENEAKALTKERSIIKASKKILKQGCEILVIKLGAKGCLVYTKEELEIVPGFKVKAIDTTGAGDVFNAAFVFSLIKNLSIKDAAIFANAVGAVKVKKLGAGKNVPEKNEIVDFLIKHKLEKFLEVLKF